MSDGYILQMKNITKTFPGVKALSDVTLEVSEARPEARPYDGEIWEQVCSGPHS